TMSSSSCLLLLVFCGVAAARESLVVTGRLLCDRKPSSSVTVALTDEDRVSEGMSPLGLRSTDSVTGNFSVQAYFDQFEEYINPVIEIVHKCKRRCIEKSRVPIPFEYALSRGPRTINLHTIELSREFPMAEETSFCTAESDITWTIPGE
ncbi:hypothetical protein PMAYCL1PPCAC_30427, partial [Pristionchus mayeri]